MPRTSTWRIAFAANEPNAKADIYVMDEDGRPVRRLTHNSAVDEFPDWSPDGKQISFTSTRDGKSDIYVMNTDGSNQHRLTFDPAGAYGSAGHLTVNGSRSRDSDGRPEIYVMNADGSATHRLTVGRKGLPTRTGRRTESGSPMSKAAIIPTST